MNIFENEDNTTCTEKQEHTLWVEKYRPSTLDNYIGNNSLKEKVSVYLKNKDIPHLLFHGKAGTGKTSLAKLITSNIECDKLYINASDENNVETVRNKIKGFASSCGFRELKVVVLDECDYVTPNAQAALRNLMETFSKTTRFILTCNYPEKIIAPIQSRCQIFGITPPSKKDVAIHLKKILKNENIKTTNEDMAFVVNSFYPDVRRIINNCQQNVINGELKINQHDIVESDGKLKLVELLKDNSDPKNKFREIRQHILNCDVHDFSDWYKYLYDSIDEYADGHVANVIMIIADSEYKDAFVVDKEINFMSCIVQILKEV